MCLMRSISAIILVLLSLSAFASMPLADFSEKANDASSTKVQPIIIRVSPYSYQKTIINLKKAISGRNYRIIGLQKVEQGYVEKGNESSDLMIYFCNFNLVNVAIKVDRRIGQFLPCRISIVERDGKVYLMAMNPKAIGRLLHNSKLKKICNRVSNMYQEIMDEVTI